jgi:uncharacterized membrane protein YdbT with pleckstrin-like domain
MQDVIKRSVPLLGFKIILLEVIFEGLYFIVRGLVDFAEDNLSINLSFLPSIAQLLILILQIAVLIYLLLKWANEYYILKEGEVVLVKGILQKQEKAYSFNNMQSVIVRQGLLSRLLRSGTVAVYIPTLGQELEFTDIPHPKEFAERIKKSLPYPGKGQFVFRSK